MSKCVRFVEGHVIKPRMELEMERNGTKRNEANGANKVHIIYTTS